MTNEQNQTKKLIIGLTGGIGSGKTAATDWFAQQGIKIVDADVIAHQIVAKGSPTLQKIAAAFGKQVLTESGELNRQAMRELVFNSKHAAKNLAELEAITHPAIREQAKTELQQAGSAYVIMSAPLLLESQEAGLASLCNRVVVIDVPEKLQIERASKRDGLTEEKIKAVMAKQLSRKARLAQADDVVVNDGTLEDLYARLKPLHEQYLQIVESY
ncbi:dephospho-CoA kinase [Psychrobacter sp. HD31]|uniref:dephospho-CoA kinase n=1 Tax=Psychrobacter sp. HD31 TaxID=3112003 RepID=UPI003DA201A8